MSDYQHDDDAHDYRDCCDDVMMSRAHSMSGRRDVNLLQLKLALQSVSEDFMGMRSVAVVIIMMIVMMKTTCAMICVDSMMRRSSAVCC